MFNEANWEQMLMNGAVRDYRSADIITDRVANSRSVIVSGMIVDSEVAAGGSGKGEHELARLIGEIHAQLQAMINVVTHSARGEASQVSRLEAEAAPALARLCAGQFAPLPSLVDSLCRLSKVNMREIDKEWLILCHKLKQAFIPQECTSLTTTAELVAMAVRVERLHRAAAGRTGRSACLLSAGYASNSRLYSSGDIRITGEGIRESSLYALGVIRIDGCAQASDLYAEQGVRINQAGSRGSAPIRIRVPAGRSVAIDRALAGTVIQIGNRTHTIVRESDFYVG